MAPPYIEPLLWFILEFLVFAKSPAINPPCLQLPVTTKFLFVILTTSPGNISRKITFVSLRNSNSAILNAVKRRCHLASCTGKRSEVERSVSVGESPSMGWQTDPSLTLGMIARLTFSWVVAPCGHRGLLSNYISNFLSTVFTSSLQ